MRLLDRRRGGSNIGGGEDAVALTTVVDLGVVVEMVLMAILGNVVSIGCDCD